MGLKTKIQVRDIRFYYGQTQVLKGINLDIYENKVTAVIGPSGCGKSTLIRMFNRMNDLIPKTRLEGSILLDKEDINDSKTDVVEIRRRVGMVFQKPNPFPKVLLFDEPCASLDPISTQKIEELILELKKEYTIVIVTHNMQQAARVSDYTAFLYLGDLIEFGETEQIFTVPKNKMTESYLTGKFG